MLDIFQINTLDIAKFMFRYHNNLLPPLFLNLFMTNSQVHTYDTRTAGNYRTRAVLSHEHQEIHNSLPETQGLELSSCLYHQFVKLSYL